MPGDESVSAAVLTQFAITAFDSGFASTLGIINSCVRFLALLLEDKFIRHFIHVIGSRTGS